MLDESHKRWKFSDGDLQEREVLWTDYTKVYETVLSKTTSLMRLGTLCQPIPNGIAI
jgi:polyphosphate kinase 2 (PPK2 family)